MNPVAVKGAILLLWVFWAICALVCTRADTTPPRVVAFILAHASVFLIIALSEGLARMGALP